jgi:hypothetical protein
MKKTTYAIAAMIVLAMTGCAPVAHHTSGETAFLAAVKPVWYGDLPSDATLIAYGEKACAAQTSTIYTPSQVVPGATATPISLNSSETDKNNWSLGRFSGTLCL